MKQINLDTEATLQGEFYHACKLAGLQCVLEMATPVGRLDAAILSQDRSGVIAVVEVKCDGERFYGGQSRQLNRYRMIGAPVYCLDSSGDPAVLARRIQSAHANDCGIPLSAIANTARPKGWGVRRARRPKQPEPDPDLIIRA